MKDINKISVTEAFNNPDGKTSANKVVGVTTSFVCLLLFVVLVIFYFINPHEAANVLLLIDKTTIYFSVAAGVMGIKTISSSFGGNKMILGDNVEIKPKKHKKQVMDEEENFSDEEM